MSVQEMIEVGGVVLGFSLGLLLLAGGFLWIVASWLRLTDKETAHLTTARAGRSWIAASAAVVAILVVGFGFSVFMGMID